MAKGALGKVYDGGEIIVHQGEIGDCMYVIQEGEVEVVRIQNGDIVRLAVLENGDFFGEMAIFEKRSSLCYRSRPRIGASANNR